MRIHTDTLSILDIRKACEGLPIYTEVLTSHGSRKRAHAFEVQLSGTSNHRAQSGDWNAATWDEWGAFLGRLFNADPEVITSYYRSAEVFHNMTCNRFRDGGLPSDTHSQHKWVYDFENAKPFSGVHASRCNSCSARMTR